MESFEASSSRRAIPPPPPSREAARSLGARPRQKTERLPGKMDWKGALATAAFQAVTLGDGVLDLRESMGSKGGIEQVAIDEAVVQDQERRKQRGEEAIEAENSSGRDRPSII